MKFEEIHQIAVLGAGLMGHGIAQSFIAGGYPVMLYDIQESVLDSAEACIKNSLALFCGADLIESKDIGPTLDRLTCTVDLKRAVEGADFITEAIPEDLALKQDIFQRVEDLCRHETILASNTSSLTLKALVSRGHDGIKSGKGFYDYRADWSEGEVEETIQKRDREFLQRLKNLYR